MELQIAKTIWSQLNSGGQNTSRVMSWGTHALVGDKDWLRFKVKGMKFKGIVKIIYVYDTYTVEFHKEKRTKNEYGKFDIDFVVVHTVEGVYNDMLNSVIDNYVEKTDAHRY